MTTKRNGARLLAALDCLPVLHQEGLATVYLFPLGDAWAQFNTDGGPAWLEMDPRTARWMGACLLGQDDERRTLTGLLQACGIATREEWT